MSGLLRRIRAWWGLLDIKAQAIGTAAFPVGQHEELTDAERFKREHGYSAAFAPLPATPELEAHNRAIEAEYAAEVEARKALLAKGLYRPRFLHPSLTMEQEMEVLALAHPLARSDARHTMTRERITAIQMGATPRVDEVDWHLEMTLEPGRRVNVTKDAGAPMLDLPTQSAMEQAAERRELAARVAEVEAQVRGRTVRSILGSRAQTLAACRGDESMADEIEARAMRAYGVTSLDQVPAQR